jgi:hypothetical protein
MLVIAATPCKALGSISRGTGPEALLFLLADEGFRGFAAKDAL